MVHVLYIIYTQKEVPLLHLLYYINLYIKLEKIHWYTEVLWSYKLFSQMDDIKMFGSIIDD